MGRTDKQSTVKRKKIENKEQHYKQLQLQIEKESLRK